MRSRVKSQGADIEQRSGEPKSCSRDFVGTEKRKARVFAKEEAVVAGADVAAEVVGRVDPKTRDQCLGPLGASQPMPLRLSPRPGPPAMVNLNCTGPQDCGAPSSNRAPN
jgi:hypothetical protein